jgi:hypothetical protein
VRGFGWGCGASRRDATQHQPTPAINALAQAAGGDRAVERELVVVELFPMRAAVPRTFTEVLQRMVQLQYTSRLILDGDIFRADEQRRRHGRGGGRRAPRRQRDPQRPGVHHSCGPTARSTTSTW